MWFVKQIDLDQVSEISIWKVIVVKLLFGSVGLSLVHCGFFILYNLVLFRK